MSSAPVGGLPPTGQLTSDEIRAEARSLAERRSYRIPPGDRAAFVDDIERRAWEKRDLLQTFDLRRLRGWLHAVIGNEIADYFNRRTSTLPLEPGEEGIDTVDPAAVVIARDLARLVQQVLKALPAGDAQLLAQPELVSRGHGDIARLAKRWDMDESELRTWLRTAERRFQKLWNAIAGPVGEGRTVQPKQRPRNKWREKP